MENSKTLEIQCYEDGNDDLILFYPSNVEQFDEILYWNGYHKTNLFGDISEDKYEFFIWKGKNTPYLVDFSNPDGGVFLFYCQNIKVLMTCLIDISKLVNTNLSNQLLIKELLKDDQ